jgi:hypothetical protein
MIAEKIAPTPMGRKVRPVSPGSARVVGTKLVFVSHALHTYTPTEGVDSGEDYGVGLEVDVEYGVCGVGVSVFGMGVGVVGG